MTNYWGEDLNIGLYRPLVQISYLLEGATVGFVPVISHAIGLILHLVVVVLLWRLLLAAGTGSGPAFWGTLAFGVNPALLDAHVWVSGRTDVMAAGFVLGGLLLGLRLRDRDEGAWSRGSLLLGLLYLLGLFSKEMAVTLPLLLWLFVGGGVFRRMPVLLTALLAYGLCRLSAVDGYLPVGTSSGVVLLDHGLIERCAIGARALLRLLMMLIVPCGLAADHRGHAWASSETEADVIGIASILVLVAMIWRGRELCRRGQRPGLLLMAVPVSLLPVLQIIPIGAVMAERFLYLPAVFLLGFVAWGAARIFPQRVALAGAVCACAVLSVISWQRASIYEDEGTYLEDVVRVYPTDHQAWLNLGVHHWEKMPPDWTAAESCFKTAISSKERYLKGQLNLARLYLDWDVQSPSLKRLEQAEQTLSPLRKTNPDCLYLLGKVSLRRADRVPHQSIKLLDLAIDRYTRAAEQFAARGSPPRRVAAAWKEAGLAARKRGDEKLAAAAFRKSKLADPTISVPPVR